VLIFTGSANPRFCFVLAELLVMLPLWILMFYGITGDGRLSSHKMLIGLIFCFAVGLFWLYEDLKDLGRNPLSRAMSARQQVATALSALGTPVAITGRILAKI
jgi:hypothetical protein